MTKEPSTEEQRTRRKSTIGGASGATPTSRRSTMASGEGARSRRDTLAVAAAKYYAPQTEHLSTSHNHRNFARMLKVKGNEIPMVSIEHDEMRRFSLVQVKSTFRSRQRTLNETLLGSSCFETAQCRRWQHESSYNNCCLMGLESNSVLIM